MTTPSVLDDILTRVASMTPEEVADIEEDVTLGTGDMVWIPQPGPQTEAYLSDADELYYGGEAGGGKGQALDAPILTPFGWRKMGDLKIGCSVSNPDGGSSKVIGIYPLGVRQLYTVRFHDGTAAEVTDDHIWLAWRARKGEENARLWTTSDMIGKMQGGWRFIVPITKPITFTDSARGERRPVDPYLLGVLLGDGSITQKALRISCGDPDIIGRLPPMLGPYKYGDHVAEYRLREPNNVRHHLEKWGLVGCGSVDKFIPDSYLLGAIEGRFELLRGLMDTDGWADKDGEIYYCTISPRLAADVAALARSLGAVVSIREKDARAQNGRGSRAYTLRIKMEDPERAFHLERKKAKAHGKTYQSMGKKIISIVPSRIEEAQCIKVDHPNSLYITSDYTVTHNTDLIIGLATTAHTDSLIMRRVGKDAYKLMDRAEQVIGHTEGRNLSTHQWRRNDGILEFQGCEHEKDRERFKGIPHDLKAFDEISDFSEGQFRFIKTWNRSSKPGQRSRVVCTGNPPTTAEGLWVIEYWAPWLDPRHPNPAKSGELRWFISDGELNRDKEVPGPGSYPLLNEDGTQRTRADGTPDTVIARSRTFIRAKLSDNKYYGAEYAAVLDALPKELRAAYRDGRFDQSLKDNPRQTIPTAWIMAAVERRRKNPKPPKGVPMCAMGVDPAGGGADEFTIAPRHDGWYADIIAIPGKTVPLGSDMAAQIVKARRDQALPIVDCGGGYGGGIIQTLGENNIPFAVHKGSEGATTRDKSGKLKFKNKRSEVIWRFREALDPDQAGGSIIELPDDARMIADLTAPTFDVKSFGIIVESKDDVCDRLKRSTDRGDAVVIAWSGGLKGVEVQGGWDEYQGGGKKKPSVVMGRQDQRRR